MQPRLPASPATRAADARTAQAILSAGSKSFAAAGWLLPAALRRGAAAIYAFCRVADDAVDEADDPRAGLEMMRGRLEAIYEGRPAGAVDRAFAEVVRERGIPRVIPEALLEGFAWDAAGRRYETLEDVYAYAARVASTVGAMMTLLMERRDPQVLARACDLGVAMQLTNIARDVGEDARIGRLYLPVRWLAEEGVDADHFLASPGASPALGRVVARLLDAAAPLYRRAEVGIAELPWACRPAIHAAALIYADIGRVVGESGYDSVSRRAVVSTARKGALLASAAVRATRTSSAGAAMRAALAEQRAAPALAETQFIVDAVTRSGALA
ncbi:MAG: phytoene/squalene synthase family protein [Myxococcales bacterium]|nr:phytoene/squalene synthase family protein [Myxococcales bacterium]